MCKCVCVCINSPSHHRMVDLPREITEVQTVIVGHSDAWLSRTACLPAILFSSSAGPSLEPAACTF